MNIRWVVGAMVAAIAIVGIIVVVSAEGQRDQSAGSAADRDQITATVARWEAAWNTHDMTALASCFTTMVYGCCGQEKCGRVGE